MKHLQWHVFIKILWRRVILPLQFRDRYIYHISLLVGVHLNIFWRNAKNLHYLFHVFIIPNGQYILQSCCDVRLLSQVVHIQLIIYIQMYHISWPCHVLTIVCTADSNHSTYSLLLCFCASVFPIEVYVKQPLFIVCYLQPSRIRLMVKTWKNLHIILLPIYLYCSHPFLETFLQGFNFRPPIICNVIRQHTIPPFTIIY